MNGAMRVESSEFQNNRALTNSGGAISAGRLTNLTLTNSSFSMNEAHLYGGAISVQPGANVGAHNCSFVSNLAKTEFAGAILASSNVSLR